MYKIGETGPSGGVIFYDKGVFSDGWRYLEAAPMDHPVFCQGSKQFNTISGTSEGLGKGKQNTEMLNAIEQTSGSCYTQAANYEFGDYTDWYLPSRDELKLIRLQNNIIPNLSLSGGECKAYWCSTLEQLPNGKWLPKVMSPVDGEFVFPDPDQRIRTIRQF
jgi:hypothetical protein